MKAEIRKGKEMSKKRRRRTRGQEEDTWSRRRRRRATGMNTIRSSTSNNLINKLELPIRLRSGVLGTGDQGEKSQ